MLNAHRALEGVLEQLLWQILGPYVDGISRDNLHLGIGKGIIELNSLTVKPDALALLGYETYRVRRGHIGNVRLEVPWRQLFTGKLLLLIEDVYLEVETIRVDLNPEKQAELIEEIRDTRRRAIDLRMVQLSDLLQQKQDNAAAVSSGQPQRQGTKMKLIRRILNNFNLDLSAVRLDYVNDTRGIAFKWEVPKLSVQSTDESFRVPTNEVVEVAGTSIFKLLHIQDLSIKMAPAGSNNLDTTAYIVSPVSAQLQLAHVPADQVLRLRIEVATEKLLDVRLLRSQVKHMRFCRAESVEDGKKLFSLLVPPEREQEVFDDVDASREEYYRLYEKQLQNEWAAQSDDEAAEEAFGDVEPLSEAEEKRLRLLEDAFSVRILAVTRLKVRNKLEALRQAVLNRKMDARLQQERQSKGFFGRFLRRKTDEDTAGGRGKLVEEDARAILSEEEREKLLAAFDAESKFEKVDLPTTLQFQFVLGRMALDLVDDRQCGIAAQQVLSLELVDANWMIDVHFDVDYLGQDSAEWKLELAITTFNALHHILPLIQFKKQSRQSEMSEQEYSRSATKLIVQSLLKKDMNLLLLLFEFAPVDIHMLPGVVEEVLDFWRPPPSSASAHSNDVSNPSQILTQRSPRFESPTENGELGFEDLEDDVSTEWLKLNRETRSQFANHLYERCPDKIKFNIRIASPILHVPVSGLGSSVLGLGELSMWTPNPCEYNVVEMEWKLDNTTIVCISLQDERFDIVQPVPIHVTMYYKGEDDSNQLNLDWKVDEMLFSVSPQALQILIATPSALINILYPPSTSVVAVEVPEDRLDPKPSAPSSSRRQGRSRSPTTPRLKKLVSRKSVHDDFLDCDGPETENFFETAVRKVEQVRRTQFRLNMTMQWQALGMTLADDVMPVMRLRVEVAEPGLVLYQQSIPYYMTLSIQDLMLETDVLSSRRGVWEPLIERFHFLFEVERQQVNELQRSSFFTVSGHEGLLINLTPSMVRTATRTIPLFFESITVSLPSELAVVEGRDSPLAAKYRVVNLYEQAVEINFSSRHCAKLQTIIPPTGSAWISLDKWVLPHFVTGVTLNLASGNDQRQSEFLSLERAGAVRVPGSGCVGELLFRGAHRLLLLATHIRLHNKTDLKLQIRFHDARTGEALQEALPLTLACDGANIGWSCPEYPSSSDIRELQIKCNERTSNTSAGIANESAVEKGVVELDPNAICAVLSSAIVSGGSATSNSQVWVSLRPVGLDEVSFCAPQLVGGQVDCWSTFVCPVSTRREGDLHFMCRTERVTVASPFPLTLTNFALEPSLAFLNVLPIGDLEVRFAQPSSSDSSALSCQDFRLPRFANLNIYSFAGALSDGIALQARLGPDAPWSMAVNFKKGSIRSDSCLMHALTLCQDWDGAGAGISVEVISNVALRISCANWFADRCSFPDRCIQVHHRGQRLPHAGGITLLPSAVFEEDLEFVMVDTTDPKFGVLCRRQQRLPPSWMVVPWSAKQVGSFIFCVQVDNIDSRDVFGANCQVMTLRPRLIITNSSGCVIELRFLDKTTKTLAPGQSLVHHWKVRSGDEMQQDTKLSFRPVRDPPLHWSGPVTCADEAAGSTPFALKNRSKAISSRGSFGVEIWSAEVAPCRGALSVTIREGSEFVALNNCKQKELRLSLRPCGWNDSVDNIELPPGQEVPYGWLNPFVAEQTRGLEVVANGVSVLEIPDVRQTKQYIFEINAGLQILVSTIRNNDRTVISAQEVNVEGQSIVTHADSLAAPPTASGRAPALDFSPLSPRTPTSPMSPTRREENGRVHLLNCNIKVSQLGISIVEEMPIPRELLYVNLDLIRFAWSKTVCDIRTFQLIISEAQVDCQLPHRMDARQVDSKQQERVGLMEQEKPAVIFANCADGDRAFLSFLMQRGATSSRDIVLLKTEIALDSVDITIDDAWLDPLVRWIDQATSENSPSRGATLEKTLSTAGRSILEDHVAPNLPSVVQIDNLEIGALSLTVWCSLQVHTVRFLPYFLRTAINILSFSGQFTLDGANLALPARQIPPHRGSMRDFLNNLGSEYTINLLNNAAALLGKSSVANLPRASLKVGGTVVSYITDSFGLAAGEAASFMSQLTFDEVYINRQRSIRERKRIFGISDGFVEAGRSLAQGIEGVSDLWRKPVEGAQQEGFGGLLSGLVGGFGCSVIKPLANLGQAFSDFGTGIAAQVAPDSEQMKRRRARQRTRLPRLLFAQVGAIRPFNALEAEVLFQLGREATAGVEEVLILSTETELGVVIRRMALVFCDKLLFTEVKDTTSTTTAQAASRYERREEQRREIASTTTAAAVASTPRYISKQDDADSDEQLDLLDALDQSALKVFAQALKPINTFIYGVRDIGQQKEEHLLQTAGQSKVIQFRNLKNIRLKGHYIEFEGKDGSVNTMTIARAAFGDHVRNAFIEGLQSALTNQHSMANWEGLHAAVLREQRLVNSSERPSAIDSQETGGSMLKLPSIRRLSTGAGRRILEVYEVERKQLSTGHWATPFLPIDHELSFRWVDATGTRHPHLIRGYSPKHCAESKSPPCELDKLFRPHSGWKIDVNEHTDSQGWMYGLAWNASTWDTTPGIFDAIRKRLWTRSYE